MSIANRDDWYTKRELDLMFMALRDQLSEHGARMQRMREDMNTGFANIRNDMDADVHVLREDNRTTSRVVIGFLTLIFVTMLACLLGVVVVL